MKAIKGMAASRRLLGLALAAAILAGTAGSALAVPFTGTLNASDGGLQGSGVWASSASFTWTVDWDTGVDLWFYEYTLSVGQGDVSHFILEVSRGFAITTGPDNDLIGPTGTFGSVDPNDPRQYTKDGPGNSNPNMPDPGVFGVKFEEAWGLLFTASFHSPRAAVWGDFYAKDGQAGGAGWNAIWNAGFAADDPLDPAGNGSVDYQILRPDTEDVPPVVDPIPEPAGLGLLGLALLSLRRRRN